MLTSGSRKPLQPGEIQKVLFLSTKVEITKTNNSLCLALERQENDPVQPGKENGHGWR